MLWCCEPVVQRASVEWSDVFALVVTQQVVREHDVSASPQDRVRRIKVDEWFGPRRVPEAGPERVDAPLTTQTGMVEV